MARIRSIKPGFFRHEQLQDLESAHPKLRPMLVFAGLWGHCDKHGVFPWKPRQLKLDILPFLSFEMSESLDLLADRGLIVAFMDGDKQYGFIPTFTEHQRINGSEAKDESPYPMFTGEAVRKQWGSTEEALGKHSGRQEGKGTGREQEGNGEVAPRSENAKPPSPVVLVFPTIGTPASWDLHQSQLEEWASLYPGMDVLAECRKALAYVNTGKRKTASGMARFLVGWLNRTANRGGSAPGPAPMIDRMAFLKKAQGAA
jgi:hypothetical protein